MYGQRCVEITCGHHRFACISCVRANSYNSLICRSAFPFAWCAPTPANVSPCCWNALESVYLLTLLLNYDLIIPKTNFMCLLCDFMTLVICSLCFPSFVLFSCFCCVDLFPQDQTPHTTHRSLHFYWESSANCRYQLPRVVPS